MAVTGAPRREIQDKQISPELERLMEGRQIYQHKPGAETIPLCADGTAFHVGTAAPILSEGDVLGCVIFAGGRESQSSRRDRLQAGPGGGRFLENTWRADSSRIQRGRRASPRVLAILPYAQSFPRSWSMASTSCRGLRRSPSPQR